MNHPIRVSRRESMVLSSIVVFFAVSCLAPWRVLAQSNLTFTASSLPTGGSGPYGITRGSDGNIWVTERSANKIARITAAGVVTEYQLPNGGFPIDITAGPDGNLWFAEYQGQKIGKITPTGLITEYTIPTANSYPYGICAGPDGNVWFTENGIADGTTGPIGGNNIGRITPDGTITEFPIPTAQAGPAQIVTGPDGNVWFTEGYGNKIGTITPAGEFTEFALPNSAVGQRITPITITAGPDGALWFGEYHANKIGRISTSGTITEFPIPSGVEDGLDFSSFPTGITVGPDGNLWFTEYGTGLIGRITTSGAIAEFGTENAASAPVEITTGADGNMWFTDLATGQVWKMALGPSYSVKALYDQTRAVKRGACYPIKIEVDNSTGANVSSAALIVHAVSVTLASNNSPGTLEDVGNANPDNDFRYDATLAGYIFNLGTAGLHTGTWILNFTVGDDPAIHTVQFQVK